MAGEGGMIDQVEKELTAEEAAAEKKLREVKARRALLAAPELAFNLRFDAVPLGGRTERGIEVPVERTPILTGLVDDADELYEVLHSWVETFRTDGKSSLVGWSAVRYGERTVIGLPANISPDGARAMVKVLTLWMLQRERTIFEHPLAGTFQDEVSSLVWDLRSAHRLTKARDRVVSPRACPTCGEFEVGVEFFGQPFTAAERRGEFDPVGAGTADERRDPGEPAGKAILDAVSGIDVRCAHCGWVGIPRASDILRWLS